ncbi:GIY-YIG nuclease family protein [Endozoicomonas lisbonensis]|uniref:GIY-YIG superfamily endonuclease n=1 Tax=Endozoicomonas lisbonensis TaxID=3120522 RepID=A0ABV2SNK4_9GAMM
MQAATIKLFLVKGSPTGLRTAEISNWTGKAIAGPRNDLNDYLQRSELSSPGVYLLTGVDADNNEPVIYIGEAENVSKRLKQHAQNEGKDYWIHTSAFVSKDDNLTKAHIKYIEGKLIQMAQRSKLVTVMNATSSGSSLPEADRAEMDVFIERMIQLLPVLGIHHFSSPATAISFTPQQNQASENKESVFYCKTKNLVATGRRSESGFTVFKGSQAVLTPNKAFASGARKYRDRLIQKGILEQTENYLSFTEDHEFSSPSAAAGLIKGGSVNGLTAWVTEDNKKLKSAEN